LIIKDREIGSSRNNYDLLNVIPLNDGVLKLPEIPREKKRKDLKYPKVLSSSEIITYLKKRKEKEETNLKVQKEIMKEQKKIKVFEEKIIRLRLRVEKRKLARHKGSIKIQEQG